MSIRFSLMLSAALSAALWLGAPQASEANQNPCGGESAGVSAPCPREGAAVETAPTVQRPCPREESQNPCTGE